MDILTPEQAWILDESVRMRKAIEKERNDAYWTKRVRDAREWNMFDYERPLKSIPSKKINPIRVFKEFIKSCLP